MNAISIACSTWQRSSPLVPPAPSEMLSPACAWVLTAQTSESLHPTLGRIPHCKKHKGTSRPWRTQVIAEGDIAPELVSLRVHASALCAACNAMAPQHAVSSLRVALVLLCGVHVLDSCSKISLQMLRLTCMPSVRSCHMARGHPGL